MPAPERPRVEAERGTVAIAESAMTFVRTDRVRNGGTSLVVDAPARLVFRDDAVARVGAPVPGRVQAVHVRLGDRVQAGSPVVTLGSPDAAGARAELRHARSVLRAAELELERQVALGERGVGLARDRVVADAAVAQAEAELARAVQANALLGRDRGGVVVVRAPIDGVVLARAVTKGAVVAPAGDPLVEIGDPSALWLRAEVFDHELPRIRDAARATVDIPGSVEPIGATVVAVGGAVDPRSRRAPVWLALDEHLTGLRAGASARVEIDAGDPTAALVPTSAIVLRDGLEAIVYVPTADRGVFERRRVAVGRPVRGLTPVHQGLAPDEDVVVEGVLLLDGAVEQLL